MTTKRSLKDFRAMPTPTPTVYTEADLANARFAAGDRVEGNAGPGTVAYVRLAAGSIRYGVTFDNGTTGEFLGRVLRSAR